MGGITENDPDEQEKQLQYLDLVASAVIFQNVVDISLAVQQLSAEGYPIDREALSKMSPYLTEQLKRFGDFVLDLETVPEPFNKPFNYLLSSTKYRLGMAFKNFIVLMRWLKRYIS